MSDTCSTTMTGQIVPEGAVTSYTGFLSTFWQVSRAWMNCNGVVRYLWYQQGTLKLWFDGSGDRYIFIVILNFSTCKMYPEN